MRRAEELQQHFALVATKMADLPVYNPELEVTTVGFRAYGSDEIGVLVTPWCMNLVLLPVQDLDQAGGESEVGSKKLLAFPSGQYEFIAGWAEGLGVYYSCSLFSPMFEFSEQAVAVDTAEEVIHALFVEDNYAPTDRQASIHAQQEKQAEEHLNQKDQHEVTPAEVSRRDFLTGGFRREKVVPDHD